MKKVFLWLFMIIVILLCIKSSLGLGEKETIIDVMNSDSTNGQIELNSDKVEENETQEDVKGDCYYTTINPVEVVDYIFDEKLTNSQMVLLNENSSFDNEEFLEISKNFDFDKNTYLLINCPSKGNISYTINELTKSCLSFNINYDNNEESNVTLLLEFKNIKVKKITYFDIKWSENNGTSKEEVKK